MFLRPAGEPTALAPIVGRGEELRDRLSMLSHTGSVGRLIRNHGDYHLGQALLGRRGLDRARLRGRARAPAARAPPQALAASRRRRDAALVRLRGARSPRSCATLTVPDGWERRARDSFLDGYLEDGRAAVAAGGRRRRSPSCSRCSSSRRRIYELRYELDHRPDWVAVPVSGILRLLEEASVRGTLPRERDRVGCWPASTPIPTACSAPTRAGRRLVRALRPAAQSVVAHLEPASRGTGRPRADRPAPACSKALLSGARLPLAYELEVDYPDGGQFRLRDPYAFPPTLGELDLHLAAEGRHEQLYERLGAHVARSTASPGRLRRLGAHRARGQRRRRLQRLGRPPAPDALARRQPASGSSSCPGVRRGQPLQVRAPHLRRARSV